MVLKEAALSVLRDGQRVTQALARLKVAAEKDGTRGFNNLLNIIDEPLLRSAFRSLRDKASSGTDGKTKERYGWDLDANLKVLLAKLHGGAYQPQPSRLVEIPKGDGRLRPIAVSNVEDKIVQRAVAVILEVVYEPVFTDSSLGFRPRRGCHDAIAKSYRALKDGARPAVVDVDIEKFFNTMEHGKLMELLGRRVADKRFLRLICRLIKAGVSVEGKEVVNEIGSPQGSVISPILANIYLHYALDEWFYEKEAGHYQKMVRYADDVIFCFRDHEKAVEFLGRLKGRLGEYRLKLNEAKSRVVDFGVGRRKVFSFLGFTFYWGKDGKGRPLLKLKTEAARLRAKVLEFKLWIKAVRNRLKLKDIWKQASEKMMGHYAYYAMTFNNKVWCYYNTCLKLLFKWLNRRSQKPSFTWERFMRRVMRNPLPRPYLACKLNLRQDVFEFAV